MLSPPESRPPLSTAWKAGERSRVRPSLRRSAAHFSGGGDGLFLPHHPYHLALCRHLVVDARLLAVMSAPFSTRPSVAGPDGNTMTKTIFLKRPLQPGSGTHAPLPPGSSASGLLSRISSPPDQPHRLDSTPGAEMDGPRDLLADADFLHRMARDYAARDCWSISAALDRAAILTEQMAEFITARRGLTRRPAEGPVRQ